MRSSFPQGAALPPTPPAQQPAQPGERTRVARAYLPQVSLSAEEHTEIQARTEQWLAGDLDAATTYIQKTAMTIFQIQGIIATRDVGGRLGPTQRTQAAKQWYEMAKGILTMIQETRARAGLTDALPGGAAPRNSPKESPPSAPDTKIRKNPRRARSPRSAQD